MPKKYMNYARTQELIYGIRQALIPPVKLVTWADGTDEEICDCIEALDNGDITTDDLGWDVGDERTVHLNAVAASDYSVAHAAQDVTLVIYEVDSYNGSGHYIVGFKDSLNEKEKMEKTNTNANGWFGSRGYTAVKIVYENMIQSTIKPIFKNCKLVAASKGGTETPGLDIFSNEKFGLLTEKEVYGAKTYSCQDEFDSSYVHSQLTWFKTASNRIKKVNGSAGAWWLRSPYKSSTAGFCYVKNDGGQTSSSVAASNSYGIAPFFVI